MCSIVTDSLAQRLKYHEFEIKLDLWSKGRFKQQSDSGLFTRLRVPEKD